MVDAAAIKMDALLPGKRQSKQPRRFCIAFDRQPVRLVPVGLIIFNEAHKMAYNKWVSLWYCIFTAYVTLIFACTVKTDRQPNENLARKTAKLWIGIWNSWIRNWRPLRARTEKLITQPDSFNKIIFLIINFARVFSFYYAVCTVNIVLLWWGPWSRCLPACLPGLAATAHYYTVTTVRRGGIDELRADFIRRRCALNACWAAPTQCASLLHSNRRCDKIDKQSPEHFSLLGAKSVESLPGNGKFFVPLQRVAANSSRKR